MKRMLLVMAVLLGTMAWAYPQAPYRVHTSPKLPARDALERMQLRIAWNTRVKVVGQRDGLYSVQLLPGQPNMQMVVQTFEGAIYLLDAETGEMIWKTKVGFPYWALQPVGYNADYIFAVRRNILHVLSRSTGAQLLYTVHPRTQDVTFGAELLSTPSAAPIADDEDLLYMIMGNRVTVLEIPDYMTWNKNKLARETPKKEPGKEKDKDDKSNGKGAKELYKEEPLDLVPPGSLDSPQPEYYWGYLLGNEASEFPPLVHGDQVSLLTTAGNLISVPRFGKFPRTGRENFEFKTTGKVAAEAGQFAKIAYVGSLDFNLYAINMSGGQLVWRYVSGAPIMQKPEVNDRDVFVVADRAGMRRVDRMTGREVWNNRDASRFLAANNSFVYAFDKLRKFYVLDHRRGTTLAKFDLSDWAIPVPNDMTDRIYLAANDGQILCLRHRDHVKPLVMKTLEVKKDIKPMDKDKKKDDEKKDDEKKDDKKDDKKDAQGAVKFREFYAEWRAVHDVSLAARPAAITLHRADR